MSLTHLEHLWWLLLLPLLFWLALPPRPRQHAWTAHMVQWRLAQAALRRRPPHLSGLRYLLLALACVAAVLAHAGPVLAGTPGATRLVVLLDASASMAARDGEGRSAFDVATAALRRQWEALPDHVELCVLRCGGDLVRRHGPSARALHDIGGPAGVLAVDLEALAAKVAAPDTVVWTVTDGQDQPRLPAQGALTCIARGGPNAAITAVRTVDRWPLPGLGVAVDVVCFAPAARTGEVRVLGVVQAAPPQPVELEPREVQTVSFELQRLPAGGRLELRLAVEGDVLPDDDVIAIELPPLPAPRIAFLADAEAGPFAKAAAETLAQEVGGQVVPAAAGAEVGLLLVDGGTVAITPGRVRCVCFGSQFDAQRAPVPWLEPQLADWDRSSALTAGLDLSELRVHCAFRETLPEGEPLLWAEQAGQRVPLAVVVGDEHVASVHFAFRLQDSNLPLLPAFPQLLRRAFVRAYGAAATLRVQTPAVAPGEQDLDARVGGTDRPLPPFGTPDQGVAAWLLLAGLVALALRAFVR